MFFTLWPKTSIVLEEQFVSNSIRILQIKIVVEFLMEFFIKFLIMRGFVELKKLFVKSIVWFFKNIRFID